MSTKTRVLALVATLAALTGCTIVPASGNPPTASEDERGGDILSQTYVRILASPPRPDATAVEIVRGFQAAMASFDDPQRKIARQYLTGAAAASWQPWAAATRVCDCRFADDLPEEDAEKFVVSFKGRQVGTLEAGGRYRAASDGTLDEAFTLVRVNGEWRISEAPQGLILLRTDLTRAYAPVEIYFPNPSFNGLVADRVRVPIDPSRGLPESLIRTLLRGPTGPLAGAVENVYPKGTELNGIEIEGDTLYVDFSAPIAGLRDSPERIKAMKAQLAWSLGTDRVGGRYIEILVNGDAFPGGGMRFKPTEYPTYNPSVITGDAAGYFVRDGRMFRIAGKDEEQPVAVLGSAGQPTRPFKHSAVSAEGRDQVAALMGDETGVWVTQMVAGSPWQRWINAQGHLTPPSWDREGEVWAVETAGGKSQVWHAATAGHQSPVPAPELENANVTAFRVARDGVRVAVVADNGAGPTVQIGSIVRGPTYRVGALETLVPAEEGQKIVDVAWRDATTLLVLTEKNSPSGSQQALAAYPIMDGDEKTSIEVPKRLTSITSTDSRILARDENGTITVWDGKKWTTLVDDGSDYPAYPLG
ncbi:LpqB family beta-propeller domain-containing protein [Herbidospora yilanensis]|uniref:LpqB family beta-propeller domain-containing protein n=1 Tax=Herbidospora yilanensis TaxID=354426 RepID=UPI000A5A03CB|nr:LpqB family beta-propeller domain-containing protein [Herbidospora yilanensis]